MKNTKGFTMIELLVVLVIIAILGGVALVLYSNVQKTSRDAKRKQDMRSMQLALEGYYARNNRYPCSSTTNLVGEVGVTEPDWNKSYETSSKFWIKDQCNSVPADNDLEPFINELPRDPKNTTGLPWTLTQGYSPPPNYSYAYISLQGLQVFSGCPKGKGQYYVLIARLENDDREVTNSGDIKFCNGGAIVDSSILPTGGLTKDTNRLLILTSQE